MSEFLGYFGWSLVVLFGGVTGITLVVMGVRGWARLGKWLEIHWGWWGVLVSLTMLLVPVAAFTALMATIAHG